MKISSRSTVSRRGERPRSSVAPRLESATASFPNRRALMPRRWQYAAVMRRKLRPCGRLREVWTEPGVRIAPARRATRRWRGGGGAPLRPARTPAKAAAGAMRHARRCADEGSGAAQRACLSLPGRRSGALVAKGVVTGGKSGLRASGGKGSANNSVRAAFVTAWYGAAIHRAARGSVVGRSRRGRRKAQSSAVSRSSRCLAGRRPAEGTLGHTEPDGGSVKSNGEAAAARDLSWPERRPGETPGMHDAAKPWRVALQRGRRGSPRPCGRTAALAIAARRNRAGGHCRTPTRRSRRMGRQRKGVTGHSRSTAAAPPVSRSEATDRPLQLSYPTPAPGPRDADPGRGRSSFARANRRREIGCGGIRQATYAAQSAIRTRRRSNRSLRRYAALARSLLT